MPDVIIRGMRMPVCCADCNMLDDRGDYPVCVITGETRGYTFPVRERRMNACPLEPLNTQRSKGCDAASDKEFYELFCSDCRMKPRCDKLLYWPDDCPHRSSYLSFKNHLEHHINQ